MAIELILTATTIVLVALYTSWFLILALPQKKSSKVIFPSISVIIPAYNEEDNIAQTIRSVQQANYPKKIEIIVVDDGSKDKTSQVARSLGVKVVKGNHLGKAKAVNLAMRHA